MDSTTVALASSPRASSPSPPPSPPRPGPATRTVSPPWTQIVRGVESGPNGGGDQQSQPLIGDRKDPTAPATPSEGVEEGKNNGKKKQVWNKRPSSNGTIVGGGGTGGGSGGGGVLMGDELWPALSESTRGSPKLSPTDSSKNFSDFVPPIIAQGIGMTSSPSASQPQSPSSALLPTMQLHSPSQSTVTSPKPNTNANHNPNTNHGRPTRQKSMKRDGGVNPMANGGISHQPSSTGDSSHIHTTNVKPRSGGGYEGSSRDNHGNREGNSRNAGGDHTPQRRNSFRRGNGGNHSWNHQRSYDGRDGPIQQPRVSPRSYVRTPPVSAPFVPPAPVLVQPYMNPMGIPDMPVVYFSPAVPFGPPLSAPVYFAAPDPQLKARIVNQIDYYFSNENLVKDTYLRQNMDENGWVSVVLIAGFKKVKELTENIQLILEAVQSSSVVEAQGDKIRKRDDWKRWIMPSSVNTSPNVATLCADIQSVVLDEKATDVNAEASSRSSGDLNSFSQVRLGVDNI